MRVLIVFVVFFLFIGCGYKPVSQYAKKELQGPVYVSLNVNIDSSEDSFLVKDTFNRLIVGYLDSKLTDNEALAKTKVYLNLQNISHTALTSDQEGFTRKYRTKVLILAKYTVQNGEMKNLILSDYSDYTVASDAQLSEERKEKSITDATERALEKLLTKIALNNLKGNK